MELLQDASSEVPTRITSFRLIDAEQDNTSSMEPALMLTFHATPSTLSTEVASPAGPTPEEPTTDSAPKPPLQEQSPSATPELIFSRASASLMPA